MHENELLVLKEAHRQEFLDLQEKTLKWIVSKSDVMQDQSKSLASIKTELYTLRENYEELKVTAKEAVVGAQNAIVNNCETLAMYVKEEIQDSEQAAVDAINGLQQELYNAHDQIALLRKNAVGRSNDDVNNNNSASSFFPPSPPIANIQSWDEFTYKFREAINGNKESRFGKNHTSTRNTSSSARLDSDAVVKAESLFKELCFDGSKHFEEFQDSYEDEKAIAANCGVEQNPIFKC